MPESQIRRVPHDLSSTNPELVVRAAAPTLIQLAEERGFTRLAVFSSVARHQARIDSDVDLLVEAPPGTGIRELLALQELFSTVMGRPVDLVTYGGLKPCLDDVRGEAVLL
ncbi:nucleotidyltransferase [Subtercola sp. Z020]|uniref:nucleotidyltransferase family protein n=1 Tax=Subtercola sp. Z020 TaxID=2080582 RepID=UPI000CE9154C|nr:nucleotidyltransferase domain-containing protein [Subtercola sp. Z020]PPF87811.1 nucleotidyltransferase [Subtercola sp. Z020]